MLVAYFLISSFTYAQICNWWRFFFQSFKFDLVNNYLNSYLIFCTGHISWPFQLECMLVFVIVSTAFIMAESQATPNFCLDVSRWFWISSGAYTFVIR